MEAIFDTDSYENDLALALLELLYKTDNCGARVYKKVRNQIMKEGDLTSGTEYDTAGTFTEQLVPKEEL